MARPSRGQTRSGRRLDVRLTDEEHAELLEATEELRTDRSTFVREAVAEALSDFRERRVFIRRQRDEPVEVERRTGGDRREPAADGATGG